MKNHLDGENAEHKRIVNIIEELDLDEFMKDEIIHAIAR